jgi:hypothetical protein
MFTYTRYNSLYEVKSKVTPLNTGGGFTGEDKKHFDMLLKKLERREYYDEVIEEIDPLLKLIPKIKFPLKDLIGQKMDSFQDVKYIDFGRLSSGVYVRLNNETKTKFATTSAFLLLDKDSHMGDPDLAGYKVLQEIPPRFVVI